MSMRIAVWLEALVVVWMINLLALGANVGCVWLSSVAFASPLIVLFSERRSRTEYVSVGILGIVESAFYRLHSGNLIYSWKHVFMAGTAFLGVGALCVLLMQWWKAPRASRPTASLISAGSMPVIWTVGTLLTGLASMSSPLTFDHLLTVTDLKFFPYPSWTIAHWFTSNSLLRLSSEIAYYGLPAIATFCMILQQRRFPARPNISVLAITLGLSGLALYQICPAVGPYLAYKGIFPNHIPSALGIFPTWIKPAPRNCIPSIHVAAAIVLWWGARGYRKWITWILGVYVVLTIIATLGTGQHYFVDLIPSPPLALAAMVLCGGGDTSKNKWMISSVLVVAAVAWIVTVRAGILLEFSPLLVWVLTAVTLAITCGLTWLHSPSGLESARNRLPMQLAKLH